MEDKNIIFICNETMQVSHSVHDAWLEWLKNERIPFVMGLSIFAGYRLVRLLHLDETEGITYAIQYEAESKGACNQYTEVWVPKLSAEAYQLWGDQFIGFRTLMEVLE